MAANSKLPDFATELALPLGRNRFDSLGGNRKVVAFIEVKTRSQNNWDEVGLLAVDSNKQQKIIQTASLFLAKYPQLAEFPCRFDVALVSYQILPKSASCNYLKVEQITQLDLGQPIALQQYQLTIEDYLPSAFEREHPTF